MARKVIRPTPEMSVRGEPPVDLDAFYRDARHRVAMHPELDADAWIARARALPEARQQLLTALMAKLRAADFEQDVSASTILHLRRLLPDALPFVVFGLCDRAHLAAQTIADVIASPAYPPAIEIVIDWLPVGSESLITTLWGMFRDLAPLPDPAIDKLITKLDRGTAVAARLLAYSHASPRVVSELLQRIDQQHAYVGALECLRDHGRPNASVVPLLQQRMRDDDDHLAAEVLARWGDAGARRVVARRERDLQQM
jgi:hypothetical protein